MPHLVVLAPAFIFFGGLGIVCLVAASYVAIRAVEYIFKGLGIATWRYVAVPAFAAAGRAAIPRVRAGAERLPFAR